jgi:hypothetical protein
MEELSPQILNEGYETLPHSNRLDTREKDQNYTFYRRIQEREVKETQKKDG